MPRKIYQRKDQFSSSSAVRLTVNGKSKTALFESKRKNGILTYETSDADVQQAIEESKYFESGNITLQSTSVESGKLKVESGGSTGGDDTTEYPDVTSFQEAKEILRAEPYKVLFQSLNSEANILKKAEECGVVFPNLK